MSELYVIVQNRQNSKYNSPHYTEVKKKEKIKPTYKTGSTEHLTVKTQIEVLVTAGVSCVFRMNWSLKPSGNACLLFFLELFLHYGE